MSNKKSKQILIKEYFNLLIKDNDQQLYRPKTITLEFEGMCTCYYRVIIPIIIIASELLCSLSSYAGFEKRGVKEVSLLFA